MARDLRAVLVNSVIAPIMGTALVYREPSIFLGKDLAGVPILVYAFLSTLLPVVLLTSLGNRVCRRLDRRRPPYSTATWLGTSASLGAVAGAAVGVFWRALAGPQSAGFVLSGCLVGATCGVVQAVLWRLGARNHVDPAVA